MGKSGYWDSRCCIPSFRTFSHLVPEKIHRCFYHICGGLSLGAMVLGKLSVPGRPTICITVGQGPTALAVGAGWGCLDIFILIHPLSPLFLPLFGRRPDID